MFGNLDAYAFQLLVLLYSFLGVEPLPKEKNPDWTVVESWTQTPDNSYKLVIESTTVGEKCKQSPSSYVVFQGVNLSINSIYVDGKLHESNSPMQNWILSQVFYRPVIHCKYIQGSKVVRQEVVAYIKYMGALTIYPSLKLPSFGFYFVYSDLFYVSALIVMLLTLISASIVSFSGQIKRFRYGLLQDLSMVAVLLSISPGKFFEVSVIKTNESYLSFLILAVFYFGQLSGLVNIKKVSILSVLIFMVYIFSLGNKNLIQLMTLIFLGPMFLWLIYTAIVFYKNLKNIVHDRGIYMVQLILIISVPVLAIYESYLSTLLFNEFIFLPIIFVICSVVNFLDTIRLSGLKKYENYVLKDEIRNQLNTIEHLMGSKNKYEEIIHDIKSPLTGLNFALARQSNEDGNVLVVLKDRLGELLSRSEVYLREEQIRWHDIITVDEVIEKLIFEYRERIVVDFTTLNSTRIKILLDPLGFKIVIAELLDNSYKAKVENVKIVLSLESINEEYRLQLNYTNIASASISNTRSVHVHSSGKGIGYLTNKIQSWGGEIDIDKNTFEVLISIKCMCKI